MTEIRERPGQRIISRINSRLPVRDRLVALYTVIKPQSDVIDFANRAIIRALSRTTRTSGSALQCRELYSRIAKTFRLRNDLESR